MTSRPVDHDARMERVRLCLTGLSVGDAFGARFTGPYTLVQPLVQSRSFPQPPWPCTDETRIALALADQLNTRGDVTRLSLPPEASRAYSPAAIVGAYFAGDLAGTVRTASEIHSDPESQAGAIAIATAACLATDRDSGGPIRLLERVGERVPSGEIRNALNLALTLRADAPVLAAAATLGNGAHGTARDTVPFAIWCASRFQGAYSDALWQTIGVLGGRAPLCAIVGGVVALAVGVEGIPEEWKAAREPLP